MKLLELTPEDALTFGSLKNFTAGESHYQQTTFPPPIMRFFSLGKEQGFKAFKDCGGFYKASGKAISPITRRLLEKEKGRGRKSLRPKMG